MCFCFRLKSLFPKQGSLKGCFRNVKAQNSHIDLKRMTSSGVSFGCNSDLLVGKLARLCSRRIWWFSTASCQLTLLESQDQFRWSFIYSPQTPTHKADNTLDLVLTRSCSTAEVSAHCTAQTTSWLSSWSSFLICPNLFQKWCPSTKTWKLRPELVDEVCSYPPFWPRFLLTSECWPAVAPLLQTLPSGIKTSKTTSSQSMAHQGSRRSQSMAEAGRKQMM